jgi:zinc protease
MKEYIYIPTDLIMKQQRTTLYSFFILFLFFTSLFMVGCAGQQEPAVATILADTCYSTAGWPQDESDLEPDPALVYGTLVNGVRYVIMVNHEPKNRVGMYLDIQTGSLQETDEQQGVAHYLEHMVFNGTTHYPPGTLVDYFQSIGMGFGADTNAHTSYDETVYKLMLPGGDRKNLADGLQVLADYAEGALLLEEEVEQERGIILSEKRARDSATSRVFKARLKASFAGTRLARRDVIGTDETLKNADAALLRQYYDSWYRPENMILVIVGDTDLNLVEDMVGEYFSGITARSETPDCPDFGRVAESGTDSFYFHEPDLGYSEVSIESVWNREPELDSLAGEIQQLREYVASMIVNYRLEHLVSLEGSPMTKATYYSGKMVRRLGYSSIDARTAAGNWQATLKLLETTLRQVLTDGFTDLEFARAKKEIILRLEKQVQVADSRKSSKLASAIIRNLNDHEVILSPEQELAIFGPAVRELSLAEVNDAFRSMWHGHRLVKVMGTARIENQDKAAAEAAILKEFQRLEMAEISPWIQEEESAFPYLPVPEKVAAVTEHISLAGIGADRYLFSNGLVLNLKKTDFQENEIAVTVALGRGELAAAKPGLATMAEMVVGQSGVGGLTREQLQTALAGSSVKVKFKVDEESFQFNGSGLSSESELLFQLLSTHLHDPAFRADVQQRIMVKIEQMYQQMAGSIEGMMQLKGERFLAGGNKRYGIPPLADMKKISLSEVREWLTPVLENAGLEISVVGDFDQDQILQLAGRYFGEQRQPIPEVQGEQISFPSGRQLTLRVPTSTDKAMIIVAWPTDDFWEISRTRRLNVLAAVLGDRLRKEIREELGATYSPSVYNGSSQVDPGYGVLRSKMVVDPAQEELLRKKLKEAGARLASGTVSEDELERALEPILTSIRDMVRTNRYWLNSVLVLSSRHPLRLEWPLTLQQDFAAITRQEISDLAEKYLQPNMAAEIILLPEERE